MSNPRHKTHDPLLKTHDPELENTWLSRFFMKKCARATHKNSWFIKKTHGHTLETHNLGVKAQNPSFQTKKSHGLLLKTCAHAKNTWAWCRRCLKTHSKRVVVCSDTIPCVSFLGCKKTQFFYVILPPHN